jgi:type 1 glutamine amidotransferase
MKGYKVCVVGGWCGHSMVKVAEHMKELFEEKGFSCQVTTHSATTNCDVPPLTNLVLQLLPAFTQAEAGCPVISVKPLILDIDHPATIQKILDQVQADYHA